MIVAAPACPTTSQGRRGGFTLIEIAAIAAALVIVLGLMVSLARYVRARSADALTRSLLADLDRLLDRYAERHGAPPDLPMPLAASQRTDDATTAPTEPALRAAADENNRRFVQAMRGEFIAAAGRAPDGRAAAVPFAGLPTALYDERSLRDAWGGPVVFMPSRHPAIGTAPGDRPFVFSAGPDRRYLTRGDNLYSYEAAPADEPTPGP